LPQIKADEDKSVVLQKRLELDIVRKRWPRHGKNGQS
jgi:hypothetical protein